MRLSLQSKEELISTFSTSLIRLSTLLATIPAMRECLHALEAKSKTTPPNFTIKAAKALAEAAKQAHPEATTYASRVPSIFRENGTAYQVTIIPPNSTPSNAITITNKYNVQANAFEVFKEQLNLFNLDQLKEHTAKLTSNIETIDERLAKAQDLIEDLNEFSDLIA